MNGFFQDFNAISQQRHRELAIVKSLQQAYRSCGAPLHAVTTATKPAVEIVCGSFLVVCYGVCGSIAFSHVWKSSLLRTQAMARVENTSMAVTRQLGSAWGI